MSIISPLQTIAVGVVVERTQGRHAMERIRLASGRRARRRAGNAALDASSPTTASARRFLRALPRSNCIARRRPITAATSNPGRRPLWVALRATDAEPPFTVAAVTADPAEGESLTETATDMVEQVPMPEAIRQLVAAFVAEHHVEQPFVKRKRDRADPEALARRAPTRDGEPQ